MKQPTHPLPPLVRPPTFGVYLWWPEDGFDWIHPDDVEFALKMIPSPRVMKRIDLDDTYSKLIYGEVSLRVRPTLWLEVESEGYEIGDTVEVKSRMGQDHPLIATIEEIHWSVHQRAIQYFLCHMQNTLPKAYYSFQIQPAHDLVRPMNVRQMELAAKSRAN